MIFSALLDPVITLFLWVFCFALKLIGFSVLEILSKEKKYCTDIIELCVKLLKEIILIVETSM